MSTTRKARRSRVRSRITTRQSANGRAVFARVVHLFGTQRAVCDAIGVRPSTLVKYRRRWPADGGAVPRLEDACRLRLVALGVDPKQIQAEMITRGLTRHHVRPDVYPRDGGYDQTVEHVPT